MAQDDFLEFLRRSGYVQYHADGGEVQNFGNSSPLISDQMSMGGPLTMADGGEADSTAAQMLKQIVPMDTRIFGSTLFGSREPITERNFTPEELAGIQQAVDTAVKRTGQAQKGSVQYVDYPRGEEIGPGYQPVGKTLGRFVYEKQPDGTTIVRDRYDFYNEGRAKNIEAYEKMGGGEKALTVLGRSIKNLVTGNIPGIPQELGDAYIGREGRDVTIKLPLRPEKEAPAAREVQNKPSKKRAPFKKGGSVERKSTDGRKYL